MSKATENDLASLHGVIARTLADVISEGSSVVVGKGEDAVVEKVTASAAYIMAGITFLKNNNITADPGSNKELDDLQKVVAERRQRSKERMSKRTIEQVAETFERDLGIGFDA
jgi:reverse gyrase